MASAHGLNGYGGWNYGLTSWPGIPPGYMGYPPPANLSPFAYGDMNAESPYGEGYRLEEESAQSWPPELGYLTPTGSFAENQIAERRNPPKRRIGKKAKKEKRSTNKRSRPEPEDENVLADEVISKLRQAHQGFETDDKSSVPKATDKRSSYEVGLDMYIKGYSKSLPPPPETMETETELKPPADQTEFKTQQWYRLLPGREGEAPDRKFLEKPPGYGGGNVLGPPRYE